MKPTPAQHARYNKIIQLRKKIIMGWTMNRLEAYCKSKMDVHDPAHIRGLIDEAAQPYRLKFKKEQESQRTLDGGAAIDRKI